MKILEGGGHAAKVQSSSAGFGIKNKTRGAWVWVSDKLCKGRRVLPFIPCRNNNHNMISRRAVLVSV